MTNGFGASNASVDKLHSTAYTRSLPIKRYDAEPLTRLDLQHNLLCHIFNDQTRCFTNPRPSRLASRVTNYSPSPVYPYGQSLGTARRSDETKEEFQDWKNSYEKFQANQGQAEVQPGTDYLTFKELYIEAMINSQRCTKNMRDKIVADDEFAEDFAKVCLLVNVGKMNTTLAFYPEMKTILRSYHPLPSLQRNENTRKTMQDAPRMKSLLKSGLLIHEEPAKVNSRASSAKSKDPDHAPPASNDKTLKHRKAAALVAEANNILLEEVPSNLDTIYERFKNKHGNRMEPITSVLTLIFILSSIPEELTALHFDGIREDNDGDEETEGDQRENQDFLSIFFPKRNDYLNSKSRAKAFLWLIWNYYQGFNRLPFDFSPEKSTPLQQTNPFNDDYSLACQREAMSYFNSLPPTDQEAMEINHAFRYRGVETPGGLEWLKTTCGFKGSTTASILPQLEKDGPPTLLHETLPPSHHGRAPELFKKRLLAPRFHKVSKEEWEAENVETQEELEWGVEMKEERKRFLIEFAGIEQKKAKAVRDKKEEEERDDRESSAIGSTSGGVGALGGDEDEEDELAHDRTTPAPGNQGRSTPVSGGGGKGKRKADSSDPDTHTRKLMKRMPQGNSSYPLANILAQANLTAQGVSATEARSNSVSIENNFGVPSSSTDGNLDPSNGKIKEEESQDPSSAEERDGSKLIKPSKQYQTSQTFKNRNLQTLFDLDLSYPPTIPSPRSSNLIHLSSTSVPNVSSPARLESLPTRAWNRILDRASRGVGDASYESADEEEEDEPPRGELSRMLRSLRCVRGVQLKEGEEARRSNH